MKTFLLMLGLSLLAHIAAAKPIGMVVAVQGQVTATDTNLVVRSLSLKSEIMLNDTIKTGAEARLQILLLDDSLVGVGAGSEMTIDEYVYTPASASDNAFGARLGKGIFRTVTGKITDLNPDRFKVKTRRATIGIRGCDLGFDTTSDDEDRIAVMAIPEGKKIFFEARIDGESLLVETPAYVVIDRRNRIIRKPLSGAIRRHMQQATTPGADEETALTAPLAGSLTQEPFTPTVDSTVITEAEHSDEHFMEEEP